MASGLLMKSLLSYQMSSPDTLLNTINRGISNTVTTAIMTDSPSAFAVGVAVGAMAGYATAKIEHGHWTRADLDAAMAKGGSFCQSAAEKTGEVYRATAQKTGELYQEAAKRSQVIFQSTSEKIQSGELRAELTKTIQVALHFLVLSSPPSKSSAQHGLLWPTLDWSANVVNKTNFDRSREPMLVRRDHITATNLTPLDIRQTSAGITYRQSREGVAPAGLVLLLRHGELELV